MRRNLNGKIIESILTAANERTLTICLRFHGYISQLALVLSAWLGYISIIFHHYKELMEIAQQIGIMREQII